MRDQDRSATSYCNPLVMLRFVALHRAFIRIGQRSLYQLPNSMGLFTALYLEDEAGRVDDGEVGAVGVLGLEHDGHAAHRGLHLHTKRTASKMEAKLRSVTTATEWYRSLYWPTFEWCKWQRCGCIEVHIQISAQVTTFLRCSSVRARIASATAEAGDISGPYSSLSSSCAERAHS